MKKIPKKYVCTGLIMLSYLLLLVLFTDYISSIDKGKVEIVVLFLSIALLYTALVLFIQDVYKRISKEDDK